MKKLFFIALVLMATMMSANTSLAQKLQSGSLDFLSSTNTLAVAIDYSQAIISKLTYSTRCEVDPDWKKGEEEIEKRFVIALAEELSKHGIGISKNSSYTLNLIPIKIDNDGETRAQLYVKDADGNSVAFIDNLHGEGGRFGSLTNLTGDGMERLAHSLGSFLGKQKRLVNKQKSKESK